MRDHETIEGLLAARELGGLEAEGEERLRAEMRSHGECGECRHLELETAEAVAAIALSLEPVEPSPGLEERTVARALAARPAGGVAIARPDASAPSHVARRPFRARALVAAVAAVAIFLGGWLTGLLGGRGTGFPPLEGRVAAFEGPGTGTLALVYRPAGRGVYLVGSGLEPPGSRTTYELWLFRGSTPVRAGCFEPSGEGRVLTYVDATVGSAGEAAVTREPTSCPPAPSTEPIFTTPL
jgi:hypothetical protein